MVIRAFLRAGSSLADDKGWPVLWGILSPSLVENCCVLRLCVPQILRQCPESEQKRDKMCSRWSWSPSGQPQAEESGRNQAQQMASSPAEQERPEVWGRDWSPAACAHRAPRRQVGRSRTRPQRSMSSFLTDVLRKPHILNTFLHDTAYTDRPNGDTVMIHVECH